MKNLILALLIMFLTIQLTAADKAGDFKLENLEGKQVKLSDYLGQGLVIVDFWATWCVPCKNELPKLDELQQKYDCVTVLAISTDKPRDKSEAITHVKSNHFQFQTLFDPNKIVQKQFNITSIPRTFVIAPDGTILYDHTGYQRGDENHYEEVIIKWLEEQKAAAQEKTDEEVKVESSEN
ncbi:MAG: TlpA disulfide reductase family protein [Candidatus Cloacimonadales bacterium]|nr:TlpA disulfide reductase family protein [Candidatus Cloacimonadales bacterium]